MAKKKKGTRKTRKTSSKFTGFQNKIPLVTKNLILFVVLSAISFGLYSIVKNDFLMRFFNASAIVFGFVAVSLLIVLLILWIIKFTRKK